jgi:hypothetical protein
LSSTVTPEFGVSREEDGFGSNQRDARIHRRLAQALLQCRFGFRELGLGVDAAHVILLGLDHDRLELHRSRDRDCIGQIEFAFAVVVADPLQDRHGGFARQGHESAIAQIDLALGGRRVELFADCEEIVAVHHQPTVPSRVFRPEAEHGDGGALGERLAHPPQRVCSDQWRVTEDDQDIVGAARERLLRRQHRVGGAAPLLLDEDLRARCAPLRLRAHGVRIGADDDRDRRSAGVTHRREHMREQRLLRNLVQHLRPCRAHAGTLAGGEHDRKACPLDHRDSKCSSPAPSYPSKMQRKRRIVPMKRKLSSEIDRILLMFSMG